MVEVLEDELKKAQPSDNAYYSRSHDGPNYVEQVDDTFAYPWWILWPEFQKRIWEFTRSHQYVVVADIANYFDCIPLTALRNTIASLGKFSENLLNLLFYLLEEFSWRPYYMPHSGVGLPQIQFDAPRLLAHAYLFKIDEELDKATNGDFVRWMDDVDAGVNSREEGKRLLRNLDNVLGSQGLRLNASKSKILSGKEAIAHFWVQENRALTIINNCIKHGSGSTATQKKHIDKLKKEFNKYKKTLHREHKIGNWDKVLKRYFTLFGRIGDPYLEKHIPALLEEHPNLREPAFKYLARLGPTSKRLSMIEEFVVSGHCEDEVSLFAAVRCIIAWETPATGKLVSQIVTLAQKVVNKNNSYLPSGVIAAVWLLAKYGSRSELTNLINSSKYLWEKSSWTARQIAGITPLLDINCSDICETITRNGLGQALQVIEHIASVKRLPNLDKDKQLSSYLKHQPSSGFPYPLPKVIIAVALLKGQLDRQQKINLHNELLTTITDRRYIKMIKEYSPV
ncbi:MAG: RNA-directed DNA polymerase [Hormoscilla sp.]